MDVSVFILELPEEQVFKEWVFDEVSEVDVGLGQPVDLDSLPLEVRNPLLSEPVDFGNK